MTESQNQTLKRTFGEITTPHDTILAQGSESNPLDTQTNTWVPSVLYDPFDATVIGHLSASTPEAQNTTELPAANGLFTQKVHDDNKEEQWVHLSRVLALQNEVAKMHLDMEGMGLGDGKGKGVGAGRARGKTKMEATRREWEDAARDGSSSSDPAHEGDEEGVGAAGDEEIDIKKAREERFASLAHEFEGRTESIKGIMDKLDELSSALTEFHTLQAPTFQLAKPSSRQGSLTPDGSPRPLQTKNSPYHSNIQPSAGVKAFLRPDSNTSRGLDKGADNSVLASSLSRSSEIRKAPQPAVASSLLEPGGTDSIGGES